MSYGKVKDSLMRSETVLLGIEKSFKPIMSAKVVNMSLVITIHQKTEKLHCLPAESAGDCMVCHQAVPGRRVREAEQHYL